MDSEFLAFAFILLMQNLSFFRLALLLSHSSSSCLVQFDYILTPQAPLNLSLSEVTTCHYRYPFIILWFLYRIPRSFFKAFAVGTYFVLEALRRSTSVQNSLYPNHSIHHLRSHLSPCFGMSWGFIGLANSFAYCVYCSCANPGKKGIETVHVSEGETSE